MAWGVNGTPHTLTSAGDVLEITDLTAKIFNEILKIGVPSGSTVITDVKLDDISNSDYAYRGSQNGTEETSASSSTGIPFVAQGGTPANTDFAIMQSINVNGEEKLMLGYSIQGATGASNAPTRRELSGKMDTSTSSAQYTAVHCDNRGTSDYDSETNLSILSTD